MRIQRVDQFKNRWAFLGIACIHVWVFIIQRTCLATYTGVPPTALVYLGVSVTVLYFAVRSLFGDWKLKITAPSVITILIVSALASAFLYLAMLADFIAVQVLSAAFLAGCGIGCSYLCWGTLFSRLSIHEALFAIFISMMVGSVIKIPLSLLSPFFSAIIVMLLPLISLGFMIKVGQQIKTYELEQQLKDQAKIFDKDRIYELKELGLGVALFGFVLGCIQAIHFKHFLFPRVFTIVSWHLLEVVVAGAIIYLVIYRKHEPRLAVLWRITLFLLVTGLIPLVFVTSEIGDLFLALASTAQTILVMLLWLVLSDISHRSAYNSTTIFGFGWLAYTVCIPVGVVISKPLIQALGISGCVVLCIYILIFVMVFLISDTAPSQQELLRGLSVQISTAQETALPTKVEQLKQRYDLSVREVQVMEYLAKGRTKAYIADALHISENTVKGHAKRLYAKLGVHSKEELLDVIEVEERG